MKALDKETILKIKNGEIDYFRKIVVRYTPMIYRYIRAKLFQKLDVEDLVQNTFISFYKAIHRFDEERPILPYLYQIAKNELKMYYRSHKETVVLDETLTVVKEEDGFYTEDLDRLMGDMPQEQQIILKMLKEGYSYKDIAKRLQRPVNTVRTLIRRARLQIHKLYNAET